MDSLKVKKGDTVVVGFRYMGLTSYETETVVKVSKGKIYSDATETPFSATTGINENDMFGATKYIVTNEKELKKAQREIE
jgi:hypothetical protein